MATDRYTDNRDDEELVAYLDGELDAEEARCVEDRLAADQRYRTRLGDLQRSWDLLDELPRVETDDAFTQSTVSLVAIKAAEDVQQQSVHWRRVLRWRGMLWTASALLAVFAGFQFNGYWLERDNRELLRDMTLIDRFDLYRQIDDLSYLRQLDDQTLFGDEVTEDAK
jgi:anti-sigma-K factor RskA